MGRKKKGNNLKDKKPTKKKKTKSDNEPKNLLEKITTKDAFFSVLELGSYCSLRQCLKFTLLILNNKASLQREGRNNQTHYAFQ